MVSLKYGIYKENKAKADSEKQTKRVITNAVYLNEDIKAERGCFLKMSELEST